MTKTKNKFIVILFFSVFIPSLVFGASEGSSIFPFLKICTSPRDSAIGKMRGFSESGSSISNPAVLPFVGRSKVSLGQLSYLADTKYSFLNFIQPVSQKITVNSSFGYIGNDGLIKTVADSSTQGYKEAGTFDYMDSIFAVAYGHKISKSFSYGISAKYIQQTIDSNSDSGASGSLGFLYKSPLKNFAMGFGVFDLGPKIKGYDLPSGAYWSIGKHFNKKLFSEFEIVSYSENTLNVQAGVEYAYNENLNLRAGYVYPFQNPDLGTFHEVNYTVGFGFFYNHFSIDYAWVPYGDLGHTHRFSFTKEFGKQPHTSAIAPVIEKKGPLKIEVAVADFRSENISAKYAKLAESSLIEELVSSGKFRVLDTEYMKIELEKHNVKNLQVAVQENNVDIKSILGVKKVIFGNIQKIGDLYYIRVNMMDVTTKNVIRSYSNTAKNVEQIRKICKEFVRKLGKNNE
ncbi:hypothetical protein ACFL58_00410 [Elusimicrobiota bacterium]